MNNKLDLRDYFSGAYVLNLDIREDRMKEFQERTAAAGITGVKRYRAIEGDKCPHPAWWRAGNGAWGCLMSHLRLAQDCLMDGLENYVVFEDDVVFSKDFAERLPRIMEEVGKLKGEWDMLYLGGQHLYRETSKPFPFREGLVGGININRTHAFAVNARFMVKFTQHIMHAPDYMAKHLAYRPADKKRKVEEVKEWFPHIDHQLGDLHSYVKTLAVDPWLCGQGASSSSVNGQLQEEQWWNDKGWGKW